MEEERERERKGREENRPGKKMAMEDSECKSRKEEKAKGEDESQEEDDSVEGKDEKLQEKGGGEGKEVTESPMASQDEEMDTSDGKRVRRKRKKKEMEEHNAESKCLD